MSTPDNTESDERQRKFMKTHRFACLNKQFRSKEFTSYAAEAFLTKTHRKDDCSGSEIFPIPFRHASLPNFIPDTEFVDQLIAELKGLDMQEKKNDLFQFKQSMELKHVSSSCINNLREVLQDQLLPLLREVTSLNLNDRLDMFCSNYDYTDTLLCHDDELEERYIAFIYYLVPDSWSKQDGGTLDLFDTDDKGQPRSIVKSIVPEKNLFVFFEVTPGSFHQVSEVLTEDKTRLAVSGWFHGPPITRPPPYVEPPPPVTACYSIQYDEFFEWINPVYVSAEIQNDINKRFVAESELELINFLKDDKYEALAAALSDADLVWTPQGPANKRSYEVCRVEHLPPLVQSFLKVMQSDALFLVLSSMTGLQLYMGPADQGEPSASDARGDNAKCRMEVQRFRHGSYTLLHDTDAHVGEMALDATLFFAANEWSTDNGGSICYVAKDTGEELIDVCPAPNCLALVYKDQETLRFVKRLTHRVTKARESQYHTINATYYENVN